MGVEVNTFEDTEVLDSCRTANKTAKVEFDPNSGKVVSLRYYVELVDICEKTADVFLEYSINEKKISYKGGEEGTDIEISGDFSKYLSVLNNRLIKGVNGVTEAMALVISQLENDIKAVLDTKRFTYAKFETDGIQLEAMEDSLSARIDELNLDIHAEDEDATNTYMSPNLFIIQMLIPLLDLTAPSKIK